MHNRYNHTKETPIEIIKIKTLFLCFVLLPTFLTAQTDFEKIRAEEEAYKEKQKKAEAEYKTDYEIKLDSLHLEYINYEIEREKEILEFEGKNLDPRLIKKVEALEAKIPRINTFFEQQEDSLMLGSLLELKNEMKEASVKKQKQENVQNKHLEKETSLKNPKKEVEKANEETSNTDTATQSLSEPINVAELSSLLPDDKKIIEEEVEANRPIYIPLKKKDYRISSHFNPNRMHPVLKKPRPHKGIDLAAKSETPIYATANGIVEIARFSKSAGNWVMINHQNGYKTKYFHMSSLDVKSNQVVKAGDLVGYVGTTGYSSGPHLHYEIRRKNTPLDPNKFMIVHFDKTKKTIHE